MMRWVFHGIVVLVLTALSFVGGAAWLGALCFRRRRLLAFGVLYIALSGACFMAAPLVGREAVPCWGGGVLKAKGIYCALNRTYVTAEMRQVLEDLAGALAMARPGSQTVMLDGGFPLTGLPLLPHLSHDDGEKADLALWYQGEDGYRPGVTRSPLGYFAFETGPSDCPAAWPSLRWDLALLQPLWREMTLDERRMRFALDWLMRDARVGKVFLEPHLARRLGREGGKLRFQGCRAARHDDHIHLQL